MIVIVLNPNQELQLIKFQKTFIKNYFSSSSLIYQNQPVWIPFNSESEQLKEISSQIQEIEILPPQIQNYEAIDCYPFLPPVKTTEVLLSKIIIKTTGKQIETILPLVYFSKKDIDGQTDELKNLTDTVFPMKLKVFKIAKALVLSENTKALEDFVWKKLK